jgi:hypothetical protein
MFLNPTLGKGKFRDWNSPKVTICRKYQSYEEIPRLSFCLWSFQPCHSTKEPCLSHIFTPRAPYAMLDCPYALVNVG